MLWNLILLSGGDGGDGLRTVEGVSTAHTRTAVRVPLLSEICLRAVGSACVYLSEQVALNGGSRPEIKWMQVSYCITLHCTVLYCAVLSCILFCVVQCSAVQCCAVM